MKKSLLIVFAAVLALSASAQRKVSFQKANIDGLKVTMSESGILTGMKSVQAARQHSFSVSNARKAAVASVDDVLGSYIFEDFADQEQTIPQDLVLKMTKTEGENKVYIANFAGYKGGITGTLNAEEGYIDFGGGQTMAEISITDPKTGNPVTMKLLLLSVHEGDNENLYDDVTFTIDDDGSLVLDQSGIYIYVDGGPYDGQGAGYFTDLVMPKCNAKETVSNDFGNGSAPTEISNEVYVEDLETAVNVYGMLGQSFVSFNINDDRTVNVEFDQPLMATPESADKSVYGDYYFFYPATKEDSDAGHITGVVSGNTIKLNKFIIGSKADTEDQYYWRGFFNDYTLVLNDDDFILGINEVKASLEDKLKNTKTYNMLGQQVDRSKATGLLIRGGKKYIKKF